MNANLHIQKLLACSNEFDEFQELDILIESPFIFESYEGEGIKQVFLGKYCSAILFEDKLFS